ncbi:AMP-binding protein [Orrella sp. 11846]|uniref:AMP-binding protein n=1 Tax=Orrella sp. 11846 TaxID=3409913 RepID=UPI003B5BDF80
MNTSVTRQITVDRTTIDRTAIESRSLQVASALHALGIQEGDSVAVYLHNQQAYLEIILACRRLGVYYTPVNWHFTAPEVQYILQDSGAKALFTQSTLLEAALAARTDALPTICTDCEGDDSDTDVIHYESWIGQFAPYEGPTVSPRGHMAYTSGTTGRPKGVVRAPAPLDRLAEHQKNLNHVIELAYGLRPGCRALLPAPIYHSAPSLFCQVSLQLCEHFTVTSRFDAEDVLRIIERDRIEVVYMVPIMYVRLLRLDPEIRNRYDLSSLRFIASTGAPCPADIKQAMIDWLGPVLNETYASSEAGLVTLATSHDAKLKPGTAGKPLPGATVRILDEEGNECAPNQTGLIYIRNTTYTDFTYRHQPEARKRIEKDGLITLGDIGYLDDDGYLFVCDRETDMVLSGGVNIYPAEIEHAMASYPGIADSAVIGVPDPEFGQRLIGVLLPEVGTTIDPDHLSHWLSERLARFKIPKTFVMTDQLPRDANGKLSRHRLRAQLSQSTPQT